jgi:putative PIN family toxin of toxin-antitoxin system
MLVVIDTDVLISTAGHPDKRFALWEALRAHRITTVTSEAAIAELEDVAARPIVQYALPLLEENFPSFLAEYRAFARLIPPPPERFVLQIDPKDSLLLNIAIEANAEILTTFNTRHLLLVREPGNPQNEAFRRLAPKLRLLHPKELAQEIVGWNKGAQTDYP